MRAWCMWVCVRGIVRVCGLGSESSIDFEETATPAGASSGDAVGAAFRATERAEGYERECNRSAAISEYDTAVRELQNALGLLGVAAQAPNETRTLHEQIDHCEKQRRRLVEEGTKNERDHEHDRKLALVLHEFQATEQSYNANLRIMEHYREAVMESLDRLGPQTISLQEFDTIFGQLHSLIRHSDRLLEGLKSRTSEDLFALSANDLLEQARCIEQSMEDLGDYAQYLGGTCTM